MPHPVLGTLISWTQVELALGLDSSPYVVALVELSDGTRKLATGAPGLVLEIDQPIEVIIDPLHQDVLFLAMPPPDISSTSIKEY